MTDVERLTDRVEALERKVAKLRPVMTYGLSFGALYIAREEIYAEAGLVGAVAFFVGVFLVIVWMLKEPGRGWWDVKW